MARSLCWASVNIVVVLFLLATFSSPPTLPPRLWGESPEPQNIAGVRQNKAPMYARYNNLQCLPCHPKLLQHTLFPACLPSCLLEGRAPSSSPGCCRVRVGSLLPNRAGTAPRSPRAPRARGACPDHLQGPSAITHFSEMFGTCCKLVTASKWVRQTRLPNTYLPLASWLAVRGRFFLPCQAGNAAGLGTLF